MAAPKKLILTYVDSLRTDMLRRAVAEERAPYFGELLERGVLIPDCVSSFPSVTPVACSEMVTGVGADQHWISGMNWYHRLERRYVEYGSSLEATRAFGVFRALYDLVYNMNLAHLSPEIETLFESLDDAGLRTACTPFLIYRGRHRHEMSLEGLMRRAVETTRLHFRHHTWGPTDLFYGDLYASREVPCKSTSIPGVRDPYAACCSVELMKEDGFDFLLLSLPDNDNYSHKHGPEATVESIAKADECFGTLVEEAGGMDAFLAEHAVILLADHAQTDVHRGLPLADLLRRRVVGAAALRRPAGAGPAGGQPDRPRGPRLPAAGGRGERRRAGGGAHAADRDRGGRPGLPAARPRRRPAAPGGAGDAAARAASGRPSHARGEEVRFRPGEGVADLRGGSWEIAGELAVLEATVARRQAAQRGLPRPAGPGLVGADRAARRRLRALARARLRGGRLGRRHPRRRRQPRRAPRRRQPRPAALRRLRAGVGRRARAVDAARRRPGRPRALRGRGER